MKRHITLATILTVLAFGPAAIADKAGDDKKTEQVKGYPLDKCVVSDEKLGTMGKPYVFTNLTQQVKLCCKSCLKDFKKDTPKFTKKIDEAAKAR